MYLFHALRHHKNADTHLRLILWKVLILSILRYGNIIYTKPLCPETSINSYKILYTTTLKEALNIDKMTHNNSIHYFTNTPNTD
jgi:hypothetical protein